MAHSWKTVVKSTELLAQAVLGILPPIVPLHNKTMPSGVMAGSKENLR